MIFDRRMKLRHRLQTIRVGSPGKFDEVFGLQALTHAWLSDPLYTVVFLDTGERVPGLGSFQCAIQAEDYVKAYRLQMINRKIEDELLK